MDRPVVFTVTDKIISNGMEHLAAHCHRAKILFRRPALRYCEEERANIPGREGSAFDSDSWKLTRSVRNPSFSSRESID